MTNFIFPRSHLAGLTLSTAGSSSSFGIAAGQCTDDANTVIMNAGSAFTKTTAAWSEGSSGGALLDAGSIVNSSWYHAFALQRPDTLAVDYGVSTSLMPTLPGAYTASGRVGSMKTDGSGHWLAFTQIGDKFLWASPPRDVNGTAANSTGVLFTLGGVPTGIAVDALIALEGLSSGAGVAAASVYMPGTTVTSGQVQAVFSASSSVAGSGFFQITTNTSAQIGAKSGATGMQCFIDTLGWIDRRGKDL